MGARRDLLHYHGRAVSSLTLLSSVGPSYADALVSKSFIPHPPSSGLIVLAFWSWNNNLNRPACHAVGSPLIEGQKNIGGGGQCSALIEPLLDRPDGAIMVLVPAADRGNHAARSDEKSRHHEPACTLRSSAIIAKA